MISPLKIFIGLGTVIGTGGAGLAGTYVLTKKTIFDSLENERPVSTKNDDASAAWTKLVGNLRKEDDNSESEKFKNVKSEITQNTDFSKLKTACSEVSEWTYSTIFHKDNALLNDFKKFCVISLGEVIDGNKFTSEESNSNSPVAEDKEKLKGKLDSLKSHTDDEIDGKVEENRKLKILKDKLASLSITAERPEVTELFNWCQEQYKSYYVSDSDNLKKLVYKYCQKS